MNVKKDGFPSTFSVDNFSSTTKLADNFGNKNESANCEDYNPFKYRSVEHPTSTLGALIHLLKGSLGIGILAMPNAFKSAGLVFGLFGTVLVGFICTHTIYILVSASHTICKRTRTPVLGYSETAGAVFKLGPKRLRKFSSAATYVVDGCLIICSLGCAVYIVFISENLKQLFDYWFPEHTFSKYMYIIFIMSPSLLLFQLRELKYLVPFSFMANIFMITSFAITLYYIFKDIPGTKERNLSPEINSIPLFFSTVIFAMEGITIIMPLENSMESPQHFLGCPGVLISAMTTQIALYSAMGFFGYLVYGEATEASITLNLPVYEVPAQIVKLLISLSAFFTYFLLMHVPMDIIWRKFLGPRVKKTIIRNIVQLVVRCALVLITVAIAVTVPRLESIIGLLGSICLSTLGILFPAIIDTMLLWNGELGAFKWKLVKNVLLGAFYLFALVSGTVQSLGNKEK